MREVQTVESLKYGARAFLYFIVSVLLGGGGIALGFAVGYNAVTIFGTGGNPVVYDTPELLAGVVLVILGGTVLFTGLFGLGYKLLADSVTAGRENSRPPAVSRESATERREPATSTAPDPTAQTGGATAGETAGERQTTPPTETDVPRQETSPAPDQSETQPTERKQTASESAVQAEDDADQWGPPGHSSRTEASSESTAPDTDQTGGSEQPDEQSKEQTAGEIAFGETTQREVDAESGEPPDDEPDEEPFPDQSDEEPKEGGPDQQGGGDEGEEPLVPEYDEIPDDGENTDTDSENGDPLSEPLEDDS